MFALLEGDVKLGGLRALILIIVKNIQLKEAKYLYDSFIFFVECYGIEFIGKIFMIQFFY